MADMMRDRSMRCLGAFFLAVLLACPAPAVPAPAVSAQVKNVKARQEGKLFLFEYSLEGTGPEANVVLRLTVQGKVYRQKELHLEGDIGKVRPGKGRKIVWNVLKDFPDGLAGEFSWDLDVLRKTFLDPTTKMEFVLVPGGCFRVEELPGEDDGAVPRQPAREECVSEYHVGKFEVTQGQWAKVMGNNPSRFKKGDRYPVEQVSWEDAASFITRLNHLSKETYRLPTEEEWEYAARGGGGSGRWAGTSNKAMLGDYAWYQANSAGSTHAVGEKKPNGIGLHDLSGNVWEWCSERKDAPRDGRKAIRGGSWYNEANDLQAATRHREKPDEQIDTIGFRLVRPVSD